MDLCICGHGREYHISNHDSSLTYCKECPRHEDKVKMLVSDCLCFQKTPFKIGGK
jgi:hypothetical protein